MWRVVGVQALGGEGVLDMLTADVGGEDHADVDDDTRHQKAENAQWKSELHFLTS